MVWDKGIEVRRWTLREVGVEVCIFLSEVVGDDFGGGGA